MPTIKYGDVVDCSSVKGIFGFMNYQEISNENLAASAKKIKLGHG